MKRGKPLERRAGLRANPDRARDWERRSRKPLPVFGRKARREQADVTRFRMLVRRRAMGWCEVRTPACSPGMHSGDHAHHVYPADRDRGVHDPARGLYVCTPGHDWIHRNRAGAEAEGWLGRG